MNFASKDNDEIDEHKLRDLVDAGIFLSKGKTLERVKLENHVDESIVLRCYKSSMIQVFMNLFSNAVDAIREQMALCQYLQLKSITRWRSL